VRENRTHGSEGGDGESRFRPLSVRELLQRFLRKSTKQADETANRLITAKVFWKFDFLLPPAVTLNLHGG